MSTNSVRILDARQVLSDYPFTHPIYIEQDRSVLETIVERVCLLMERLPDLFEPSAVHFVTDENGYYHRYIIHPISFCSGCFAFWYSFVIASRLWLYRSCGGPTSDIFGDQFYPDRQRSPENRA